MSESFPPGGHMVEQKMVLDGHQVVIRLDNMAPPEERMKWRYDFDWDADNWRPVVTVSEEGRDET